MSTRGCVAIKTEDGWRGVYNHWDSYPTGLGKMLWDHLQGRDLKEFATGLLRYGNWEEYLNEGVCKYCGKRVGQPCNISGTIFSPPIRQTEKEIREYWEAMSWAKEKPEQVKQSIEAELEIMRNIERTGYSDPEVKYHSHIGKEAQITNDSPDPLFLEWVYIIDSAERTMTILAHQSDRKTEGKIREEPIKRDDGYWDYGHCAFRHIEVAKIELDADEPDWELLEAKSRA